MRLPFTYYDELLNVPSRSEIVVNATFDGEDLSRNACAGPIAVFDDSTAPRMMPTLEKYADAMIQRIAKANRITVEQGGWPRSR
jgi:hypothetical protein